MQTKMKRLLLPLIAALALPTAVEANWFGYGSSQEASRACTAWKYKKKVVGVKEIKKPTK